MDGNFTVSLTNLNEAPGGGVNISGVAEVGNTLTASNDLTDPDGLGGITYNWKRDGVGQSSGTNYLLTQADVGAVITVVASYTDGGGFENNVSSTGTATVVQANSTPDNLSAVGTLSIPENQSIGSVVGEFSASDADGDALTYQFASGTGDSGNSLFTLESNGTLRTGVVFDYESNNSSYSIRVEAVDQYNASVDGNFTIVLENILEDFDQDGIEDHFDDDIDGDGFLNIEEIAYGSNPYDPESVANEAPVNFVEYNALTIIENQPIGTVVGQLIATDPDGDGLTYELTTQEGSEYQNSYFTLDADGSLKTATVFDYETNDPSFTVRARAYDEFNASIDANFTIYLVDQTALAITTSAPYQNDYGELFFGGDVATTANIGTIEEVGFVVGEVPFLNLGDSGQEVLKSAWVNNDASFGLNYTIPSGVSKLYVVAYGKNAEGTTYGMEEVFEFDKQIFTRDPWLDAQAMQGLENWWESSWFGQYYRSESGWFLHSKLGWIYPSPSIGNGLWIWREEFGWLWTENGVFPYLFSVDNNNWIYFYGNHQQDLVFYDYEMGNWQKITKPADNLEENNL